MSQAAAAAPVAMKIAPEPEPEPLPPGEVEAAETCLRISRGRQVSERSEKKAMRSALFGDLVRSLSDPESNDPATRALWPKQWADRVGRRDRAAGDLVRRALAEAEARVRVAPDEPEAPAERLRAASLADIRKAITSTRYIWPNWIPDRQLTALAALPGTGKTRMALDLARRYYYKLPLPDGAENPLPAGRPTLWVPADYNYAELLAAAEPFGLPDEAIRFNADPDDPTGGLNLDDAGVVRELGQRAREIRPALIIIDTIGMTTKRNLSRPEESFAFFAPLLAMAVEAECAILALTHLNLAGEAIGRRIVEKARSVIYMTQPDPEGQPNRRRLWVHKSNVIKPPPLGITMGDGGNDYDDHPPVEPESGPGRTPTRPGPKSAKTSKAVEWLRDYLSSGPAKIGAALSAAEDLGYPKSTVYRAADVLRVATLTPDGGPKYWELPKSTQPESNEGVDDQ